MGYHRAAVSISVAADFNTLWTRALYRDRAPSGAAGTKELR
ncbi:MAG: hypothetical protein OEM49_02735 [Myxococcales bacterium]|nr:hypothetical protein [Myxococcales bacterium]MDH5566584.1 hypothetical protein [Myxococcales bacterium]